MEKEAGNRKQIAKSKGILCGGREKKMGKWIKYKANYIGKSSFNHMAYTVCMYNGKAFTDSEKKRLIYSKQTYIQMIS